MRKIILTVLGLFVPFAAWGMLRGGASAAPSEPLWTPLPGVASAPSRDPLESKDICAHAVNLKGRFNPSSVRTAVLGYVIETDGSVDDIAVAGTSGSKALDQAIVACVATLRFQPAKKGHAMTVEWK